ncbi:MAG: hypothetical protein HQ541_02710 [Mariniphaga sp.]|nr:hypothetical protein [Mariniphaga sp.]
MKPFLLILLIMIIVSSACVNNQKNKNSKNESEVTVDSIVVAKKVFESNPSLIEYEVPVFRGTNMKHGVQKRFYQHGSLYSEIPYSYGKRQGVAYTYYPDVAKVKPVVWKEQTYKNDALNGICNRYHKNGVLQAEYEYKDGLTAIGLKEFKDSGKPVKLPDLIVNSNRAGANIYITAQLSNKAKKVDFYLGDLVEGKYLPDGLKGLQVVRGLGEVLVPVDTKSVTITAVYFTQYRNKYIVSKTITL